MKYMIRIFSGFFFLMVVSAFAADSALVELAKKEKERRSKVEAKKTFTNQDIEKIKGKQLGMESSATQTAEGEGKEGEEKEEDAAQKDASQSEEYWRAKKDAAVANVEAAQAKVDQLQTDANALYRASVTENDQAQGPLIQSEKAAKQEELEAAKKTLEDAKAALSNLEDDARKAGVPPGWVRD